MNDNQLRSQCSVISEEKNEKGNEGIATTGLNNSIKTGCPKTNWIDKVNLLQEAEECLGQSLLIFLYADLRLLSATGRINTKFDSLYIDSDHVYKTSASVFAANCVNDLPPINKKSPYGIYPAQIMAVLLTELRLEVLNVRHKKSGGEKKNEDVLEVEESLLSILTNRKDRSEHEHDMSKLIRVYYKMVGGDLNEKAPEISYGEISYGEAQGEGEFQKPFSMFKNTLTNNLGWKKIKDQVNNNNNNNALHDFQETTKPATITDTQKDDSTNMHTSLSDEKMPSKAPLRRYHSSQSFRYNRSVINKPRRISVLYENSSKKALLPETITKEITSVGDSFFQQMNMNKECNDRILDEDELLDLMQRSVQSRLHSKMSFMNSFFKDGSICQLLAKSKAKIVWMNDWFPSTELTYVISVNEEKKTVMVVFRGAITQSDWNHGLDYTRCKIPNPVTQNYLNKRTHIRAHRGFYRYLFRPRKDTGSCKYDEIANILHSYGIREIGQDYNIFVTGHSLGGALSTLFGFFASTDERFTKNGHVKILNFGSPYVGDHSFADAFRFQERTFKLQFARFQNSDDIFPRIPFNLLPEKRGSRFQHVGIGIKIPRIPLCKCFICLKKTDKFVRYTHEHNDQTFLQSWGRALKNNCLLHLTLPWRFRRNHTLDEHQMRLLFWRTSLNVENDPLLSKSLEDIYKEVVFKKARENS